jgi:DNA polymerase-1
MDGSIDMIKLTRPPCANVRPGNFDLPGMPGCSYSIGREVIADATHDLMSYPGVHLACDIESAGMASLRYDVKAVTVATHNRAVIYDPRDPYQLSELIKVLNGTSHLIDFHNSTFDVPILNIIGALETGSIARVVDTLIWARLAEPDDRTSKSLINCSARYLGTDPHDPLKDLLAILAISKAKWFLTTDLDTPAYRFMAASDAIATHRLTGPVRAAAMRTTTEDHPFPKYGVTGSDAEYLVDREQGNNRLILPVTCRGMRTDPDYLDAYQAVNIEKIAKLAGQLEAAGIRPGVNADMARWLADHDELPANYPKTTKTKLPSGDKKDLARIKHPLVPVFLDHKNTVHIGDYLAKVMTNADDQGLIHPSVSQLAAVTGRMSVSGDFPYQQMPEAARAILLAPPGERLVSIDWSGQEAYFMACWAGDYEALDSYEAGNNFFDLPSRQAHVPMKIAKAIVYGSLYGQGVGALANQLDITMDEARAVQAKVWEVLPRTNRLAGRGGTLQTIAKKFKKIFTMSGRILPIPHGYWPCWERHDPDDLEEIARCRMCNSNGERYGVLEHLGVNYPTQGGAYDMLAEAIAEIGRQGLGDCLWAFMHDELVILKGAEDQVRKIMETPCERFVWLAGQTTKGRIPKPRTDLAYCVGEAWAMPPEESGS